MKGVYIIKKEELTVPPLTGYEQKWIERLHRTLAACPDRLEIVTIGDPTLQIIDKNAESALSDGSAYKDGAVLAIIDGGPLVHGVSG